MASRPCKCAIGRSPYRSEIEQFIINNYAYSVISEWMVAKGLKVPSKPIISRHKTDHMGLEASKMSDERKFEAIQRTGKTFTISEVRDMAMQEFAERLRTRPGLIGNAQLIPFLVESLRAENRRPPSDPLDAILTLFQEVTASDEASAGGEAPLSEGSRDAEGLPEESSGFEEDRPSSGIGEELYRGPREGEE